MEDEPKLVKVNCSFCGKEIKCPEDMLESSEKHMCFECFRRIDRKKLPGDLSKVHVDIPMDKIGEVIPEEMTNAVVEEAFPELWQERKKELKEMSKKEIAKEMFGEGAYIAIDSMMQALKDEAEKENRIESKTKNKRLS